VGTARVLVAAEHFPVLPDELQYAVQRSSPSITNALRTSWTPGSSRTMASSSRAESSESMRPVSVTVPVPSRTAETSRTKLLRASIPSILARQIHWRPLDPQSRRWPAGRRPANGACRSSGTGRLPESGPRMELARSPNRSNLPSPPNSSRAAETGTKTERPPLTRRAEFRQRRTEPAHICRVFGSSILHRVGIPSGWRAVAVCRCWPGKNAKPTENATCGECDLRQLVLAVSDSQRCKTRSEQEAKELTEMSYPVDSGHRRTSLRLTASRRRARSEPRHARTPSACGQTTDGT